VRPLILGLIASFALAPAAQATLVFNKGADTSRATVWVANDDGSSARRIARGGLNPRVSPDGTKGWSPDWNR
jgi:hypothetical protein